MQRFVAFACLFGAALAGEGWCNAEDMECQEQSDQADPASFMQSRASPPRARLHAEERPLDAPAVNSTILSKLKEFRDALNNTKVKYLIPLDDMVTNMSDILARIAQAKVGNLNETKERLSQAEKIVQGLQKVVNAQEAKLFTDETEAEAKESSAATDAEAVKIAETEEATLVGAKEAADLLKAADISATIAADANEAAATFAESVADVAAAGELGLNPFADVAATTATAYELVSSGLDVAAHGAEAAAINADALATAAAEAAETTKDEATAAATFMEELAKAAEEHVAMDEEQITKTKAQLARADKALKAIQKLVDAAQEAEEKAQSLADEVATVQGYMEKAGFDLVAVEDALQKAIYLYEFLP